MTLAVPRPHEPDFEELRRLRQLNQAVDDLLENSLRGRENLAQTFSRALPILCSLSGARAVAVTAINEELQEETWSHGDFAPLLPAKALVDHPRGVHRFGADTLATQPLDVAGQVVGRLGFLFEGDRTAPAPAAAAMRVLDTVAEELDTVLVQIQTASEKQRLILQVNEHLANPVFEVGMDRAVLCIAEKVLLPGMMLVYRDAVDSAVLHYRAWRGGVLEHDSGRKRWPAMDEAIAACGGELISRGDARLRKAVGAPRMIETLLISGASSSRPLGKLVVWSEGQGFGAYALDIVTVVGSALAQRLMDYNRERIHLSQFFSSRVIDELLRDPTYEKSYLSPREEEVGILFADINGFTRICEQVLESPSRIGHFVDRWSGGVVDILWKHGGVFDKMVGDCVIGLFGPPFFRSSRQQRAEAVVRAAQDIQALTRQISAELPEAERIRQVLQTRGLGVAIGVNLAPAFCGLFGPNQDYTGFSTGMNQTARLQSLGGFRQTLVMARAREALVDSADPALRALRFGPLCEVAVKNVSQPLRYFELLGDEAG
jgi:adenylate cyclase